MADYPARGATPWDVLLKAYLDEQTADLNDYIDSQDAIVLGALADQVAAIDTRLDPLEEKELLYPWSGIEIVRSENATGTVTGVAVAAAASATIPGTQVTVPAGIGPVELQFTAMCTITATGGGLVALELWDDADAAARKAFTSIGFVPTNTALFSGAANRFPMGVYRLDASGSDRTYRLKTVLYRDGGSVLAVNIQNGAGGASEPSVLKVVGL